MCRPIAHSIEALTVFYDETCGFCVRSRRWLQNQARHVQLRFVAMSSGEAREYLAALKPPKGSGELIVVSDTGGVYRGTDAMLMCLWALQDYQRWATRLARPALRPLVRRAFEIFCGHRHAVSRLLGLEETEGDLEEAMTQMSSAHRPDERQ